MDAWIQPKPSAKVYQTDKDHVRLLPQGVFPKALQQALRQGRFEERERELLRDNLKVVAMRRIQRVQELWSKLHQGEKRTFACIWATGEVNACLKGYVETLESQLNTTFDENWLGWGLPQSPVQHYDDLSSGLRGALKTLIEDAVDYVDWALEWPGFVQAVRAATPGTLRTDIDCTESPPRWPGD